MLTFRLTAGDQVKLVTPPAEADAVNMAEAPLHIIDAGLTVKVGNCVTPREIKELAEHPWAVPVTV